MFKIIAFFLFFSTLPFSVYSKGSKEHEQPPAWVLKASEQYPDEKYLTAVQTAPIRKEAELNAIEALAAIFERTVTVQTRSSLNYTSSEKNGTADTNTKKNVDKQVQISTDAGTLVGIEIKAVWQDEDNLYYALAVLNKKKAAMQYKQQIESNKAVISELITSAETEGYSLNAYRQYRRAYKKALENEQYRGRLAVLQPPSAQLLNKETGDAQTLQLKYTETAQHIPIGIHITGDKHAELATAFEKVFTTEGFEISTKENVRYMLNANLITTEEAVSDKSKIMIRYTFQAVLSDTTTGTALQPYACSGREIHFTTARAEHKVFTVLKKNIETAFAAQIAHYLE